MSYVTTQPEMLNTAARDLASIGSAMDALNAAAASLTTAVVPAAADEVSAVTAVRFAIHARLYQLVSARATAIHDQFVAVLSSCGCSYAATEAANTAAAGLGGQ
ncbi:PE family protein [Mycobacterium shinjukuense]|uniref:PE family protein PE13 n=1 Tax=Mycobacterium shinjukuense TaxID=398694 RepID=A0A7I7MTL2_9MYCO|nr:PE family protein [Mycobacterium shinjukuense]MCV6984026.1 PE family protein [Mycobacterium shinjukuense]ORB64438.1 PE family protein [Mycobacterium shinjukuense]BBX75162.1 PE family protein PE13 [Mycobacterium shinjukuense]